MPSAAVHQLCTQCTDASVLFMITLFQFQFVADSNAGSYHRFCCRLLHFVYRNTSHNIFLIHIFFPHFSWCSHLECNLFIIMCSQAELRRRKYRTKNKRTTGKGKIYNNKNTDRFCIAFASERQCVHTRLRPRAYESRQNRTRLQGPYGSCRSSIYCSICKFVSKNWHQNWSANTTKRTDRKINCDVTHVPSCLPDWTMCVQRCIFFRPFSLSFNGSVYSWKVIHLR